MTVAPPTHICRSMYLCTSISVDGHLGRWGWRWVVDDAKKSRVVSCILFMYGVDILIHKISRSISLDSCGRCCEQASTLISPGAISQHTSSFVFSSLVVEQCRRPRGPVRSSTVRSPTRFSHRTGKTNPPTPGFVFLVRWPVFASWLLLLSLCSL